MSMSSAAVLREGMLDQLVDPADPEALKATILQRNTDAQAGFRRLG